MKTIHTLVLTSFLLAECSGLAQTNRIIYPSGATRGVSTAASRAALSVVLSNTAPVVRTIRLQNQALPAASMGRATPLARGRMQPLDSTPTCATPPGLAAWWPGGGDDAFDAMGNNPGTLQNGALASYAAMVGDGFGFDGISQAIEIPHSTTLATPNYSVEAWIYPSAQVEDPTGQALIFGQCNGLQA